MSNRCEVNHVRKVIFFKYLGNIRLLSKISYYVFKIISLKTVEIPYTDPSNFVAVTKKTLHHLLPY